MIGRVVQREVPRRVGRRENFHFVEMQPVFPRHGEADKTARLALQVDGQGFVVADAAEHRAVVLVNGPELPAIVGKQHLDPRRPGGGAAAIPDHDPPQVVRRTQVDLPPRIIAVARVKPPLAILDPVAAARGIVVRGDRFGNTALRRDSLRQQPVRFEAL